MNIPFPFALWGSHRHHCHLAKQVLLDGLEWVMHRQNNWKHPNSWNLFDIVTWLFSYMFNLLFAYKASKSMRSKDCKLVQNWICELWVSNYKPWTSNFGFCIHESVVKTIFSHYLLVCTVNSQFKKVHFSFLRSRDLRKIYICSESKDRLSEKNALCRWICNLRSFLNREFTVLGKKQNWNSHFAVQSLLT